MALSMTDLRIKILMISDFWYPSSRPSGIGNFFALYKKNTHMFSKKKTDINSSKKNYVLEMNPP